LAAALAQAGLPLPQAVQWIVEDAQRPLPPALEGEAMPQAGASPPRAAAALGVGLAEAGASSAGGSAPQAAQAKARAAAVAAAGARGKPRSAALRRPRGVKLRSDLKPEDVDLVPQIVAACGTFRVPQAERARTLVARRLAEGPACGFEALLAERKDDVVGFLLYGKDPLAVSSYDILWVAVEPSQQGQGIGRMLLEETERRIAAAGGTQVVVQALEHPEEPTSRAFYEHCGYTLVAVLEDYYGPGENQALYRKVLAQ
jgi:ribosomal protein S18 acetylase RimI-like enzyme